MDETNTRGGVPQALQGQWPALLHDSFRRRAAVPAPADRPTPRGPGLRTLALVAALSVAAAVALAAGAPRGALEQRHAAAWKEFAHHRYAQAYGHFAELADEGHAPAAWLALMLVSQDLPDGAGGPWSATPGQLTRWSSLAIADLRERSADISGHDRGE